MKRFGVLSVLPAWMVASALVVMPGAAFAGAQPAPAPSSASPFGQLLEKVRGDQRESLRLARERERRFSADKESQARELAAARRRLDELLERSAELEKSFGDNEEKLLELERLHHQRAGDLEELSAVIARAAADAREALSVSFIRLVLSDGDADEKLTRLAKTDGLPDLESIRYLWHFMLELMALQGASHRFQAEVVLPDGRLEAREVTHVGPFTALSRGRFLKYLEGAGGLADLAHQPGSRYLAAAAAVTEATTEAGDADAVSDFVAAPVDPTRGALLSLLVHAPTLAERVEQGGVIAYLILALGLIGVLLAFERIASLARTVRGVRRQKDARELADTNPLGRVLAVARGHPDADAEGLELSLHDAVIREMPPLERGLGFLKVLAAIAPLLGLLGTVVGMIETFQAITLFGTGDPRTMAGGISQALVTTALGLIVAVPLLLLHTFAAARSREIRQILEEQSAGLVALRARGVEASP